MQLLSFLQKCLHGPEAIISHGMQRRRLSWYNAVRERLQVVKHGIFPRPQAGNTVELMHVVAVHPANGRLHAHIPERVGQQ